MLTTGCDVDARVLVVLPDVCVDAGIAVCVGGVCRCGDVDDMVPTH